MLVILVLLITKDWSIRRDRCAFRLFQSLFSIHRFHIISGLFVVSVQERLQQLKNVIVISCHLVQLR